MSDVLPESTPSEEKGKWYGPYKILSELKKEEEQKIHITFVPVEHGTTPDPIDLDTDVYTACVTDESSDLTSTRHKRVSLVAADIMKILLKRNIYVSDFEYLVAILTQSLNDSLLRAGTKLWGKEELDRTIEDVDNVLKSNK